MRVLQPAFEIVDANNILRNIELGARTCYKSEDKMGEGTWEPLIGKCLTPKHGVKHESVIEHGVITIRFVMDRGVSHEQVRHRHTSPSQESTRYCNYAKDKFDNQIAVIDPFFFRDGSEALTVALPFLDVGDEASPLAPTLTADHPQYGVASAELTAFDVWVISCIWSEWAYITLTEVFKRSAQEARSVLPNSLKTELLITANVREWRHILKLRTNRDAHPQMRQIMVPLAKSLAARWPILFSEFADCEHPCPAIELTA